MFKNLIKYTIGLPLLFIITFTLIFTSVMIFCLEFCYGLSRLILNADFEVDFFVPIDMLNSILKIWKPIE